MRDNGHLVDEASATGCDAPVWPKLRFEARQVAEAEPALCSWINATILAHDHLGGALGYHIAHRMAGSNLNALQISEICEQAYGADPEIVLSAEADMQAVLTRDPACRGLLQPFLLFKGFLALQIFRLSHWLWIGDRQVMAWLFQSRVSELFQIDIHPAAEIGRAVMFDHATSIVIGETACVGDGSSLLHEVTLGGTGKEHTDRHPKIGNDVIIGAGAKILGDVAVGDGARIGASSVVLKNVPPMTSVAGVPARRIGRPGDVNEQAVVGGTRLPVN